MAVARAEVAKAAVVRAVATAAATAEEVRVVVKVAG
jgi:hypothetical protein